MNKDDKPTTECVLGPGEDGSGYGRVHIKGKRYMAHRAAYCQAHGLSFDDIKGRVIRHLCDTRRCINPDHLEVGTQKENMADMVRRRRNGKLLGEAHHSAKLTSAQVLEIRATYRPRSREFGTNALAKKYGVGSGRIHKIVTGRAWKHLLAGDQSNDVKPE